MTFTTTQGSGANDATSFVGTAGVDTITVQEQAAGFRVEALDSGDNILLSSFTSTFAIDDATVLGGQGNDSITTTGSAGNLITVVDSVINGNQGTDAIGVALTNYSNSNVYGGQGNDTILVNNLYGGFINGNKNADTITAGNGGTVTGQIYGGQGQDTININGNVQGGGVRGDKDVDILNIGGGAGALTFTNATFNGNGSADQITWNVTGAAAAVTSTTVYGGSGDDVITSAATTTEEALYSGDLGNDTITMGDNGQNDTVLGGAGTDTISVAGGTNRVEAGTGADTITVAAGTDTIIQSVGDSNACTGNTGIAAGTNVAGGDTITIDADVVGGFQTTDRLSMGTTTAGRINAAGLVGVAQTSVGINTAYGSWNDATNVFTFANNLDSTDDDVLVFTQTAAVNLSSNVAYNTNAIILEDFWASGLNADISIAQFV